MKKSTLRTTDFAIIEVESLTMPNSPDLKPLVLFGIVLPAKAWCNITFIARYQRRFQAGDWRR